MCRNLIRLVLLVSAFISFAAQAHHTALPEGMSEVKATWLWGYYTIPGNITLDGSPYWYSYAHTDVNKINNPAWTEVAAKQIKHGMKAPAVLLLHGCSGLARGPAPRRLLLMKWGYAIFEPDSFARPGRTCNQRTLFKRTEELDYALKIMRTLPWVDPDRIVLMGISQGGAAVAAWGQPGFAAHIIVANNCTGLHSKAPAGTPVLAVIGEKDDYTPGSSCKIDRKVGGSKSIVIPGAGHALDFPENAVEAFLTAVESM